MDVVAKYCSVSLIKLYISENIISGGCQERCCYPEAHSFQSIPFSDDSNLETVFRWNILFKWKKREKYCILAADGMSISCAYLLSSTAMQYACMSLSLHAQALVYEDALMDAFFSFLVQLH